MSNKVGMTKSQDCSIHVSRDLGAVIVTVLGALYDHGAAWLGAELSDLIDGQGNLTVVVDLRHTTRVDPAGLGVFAAASDLAERHGGQLTLSGASDDVYHALASRLPASVVTRRHVADTHDAAQPRDHLVEFYQSDDLLAESVSAHLEPALGEDAAIMVATKPHRDLFEAALTAAGIDVQSAREAHRYIDLDAEETLSLFMVDGVPDPIRFEITLTKLLARAAGGGRGVRVYGEMVAVLWDRGNITGAVALEDLWNDLARSQQFCLFCAYPLAALDQLDMAESFQRICEQHSTVIPTRR